MRGLLKRSGKRTVCGMVSSRNQKPPSWEKARVATALYHAEAFVCLLKSAPSRIMRVNVSGQFNLSFTGPERQTYRNWHWRDTMTLVRGTHTFKWGYEGMYVNFDLVRGNGARSATFTGTRSGFPVADFLVGAFDQVSYGFGAADSFPLIWKHQAFFQDEFKITPRMTLNFGVRYEPWLPWKQEYGRYTSWAYGVQSVVKPDAPRGILFVGDP